jgi:lipopolysaccharide/colanic/teichoic acid biosynthesis glycosyltransferase
MIAKRLFDLMGSMFLIGATAPVMAACAAAIKATSKGPVFFRQDRLGERGRVFRIFKFRTMVVDAAKHGTGDVTFKADPRITRVGRMLRDYRLDELPQLFNVVRGEMSLVGPRPLLPKFLAAYSDHDRRRLEVLPGMTGWQQVNGGSNHTWQERIDYDVWYVDHQSLWLDLEILFKTVLVVLRPTNVYAADGSQLSGIPTAVRAAMEHGDANPRSGGSN